MNRSLRVVVVAAIMAVFVYGCGDSPTGIEDPPPSTPSFSLVLSGGVTVEPGLSATTTLTVVRKDFSGSVALNVTGVPTGMTVTFAPPVVVGGTQAIVTVTVDLEMEVGFVQLVISGEALGPDNQSVTLNVGVTAPTPVSIFIGEDTTLVAPGPLQLSAFVNKSNGTREEIISSVRWSYDNYSVGEVNSSGLVLPHKVGDLEICASWMQFQDCLQIQIVGTLWSELPPLGDSAKAWIKGHLIDSRGRIHRLPSGPNTIYIGSGFEVERILSLSARVSEILNGELTFEEVVADPTTANLVVTTDFGILPTNKCGYGGLSESTVNGIMTQGIAHIREDCMTDFIILHEMFHAVGFFGHTTEPGLMSNVRSSLEIGPLLSEIMDWLYSPFVHSGMIPVDSIGG